MYRVYCVRATDMLPAVMVSAVWLVSATFMIQRFVLRHVFVCLAIVDRLRRLMADFDDLFHASISHARLLAYISDQQQLIVLVNAFNRTYSSFLSLSILTNSFNTVVAFYMLPISAGIPDFTLFFVCILVNSVANLLIMLVPLTQLCDEVD